MGRKKLWIKGDFKKMRINLPLHIYDRYKMILKGKKRSVQKDIGEYVKKVISE